MIFLVGVAVVVAFSGISYCRPCAHGCLSVCLSVDVNNFHIQIDNDHTVHTELPVVAFHRKVVSIISGQTY